MRQHDLVIHYMPWVDDRRASHDEAVTMVAGRVEINGRLMRFREMSIGIEWRGFVTVSFSGVPIGDTRWFTPDDVLLGTDAERVVTLARSITFKEVEEVGFDSQGEADWDERVNQAFRDLWEVTT